jgi:RNA polymerase sigma factor (TIGR02999 family)
MIEAPELTQLLLDARDGDRRAEAELLPLLYEQLRSRALSMMRRESAGHTLQPTALVHEAYMRLVGGQMPEWQDRAHFMAVSAQVMRRVLVDHARARLRSKRGGDVAKVSLDVGLQLSAHHDPDVLALEDVLEGLAALNPRQARIIVLRFFGGLTVTEVATELDVSKRTIEAEWTMAKAWLRRELSK